MEYREDQRRSNHLSGALLIVRDTLIFLMLFLTFVLIYVIKPGTVGLVTARAASASTDPSGTAQEVVSITTRTSASQISLPPDATEDPGAGMPAPTPTPAASPTPYDPMSNGDFSSVFPDDDTGKNADLSYQGDSMKIAINKIQKDGITYFIADVYVKNIEAFHTAFAKGTYGRGIHEMPLKIADENQAVFAVSGDYYGAREQGVVVRNGSLYRDVMGEDVCILRRDGTLSVYKKEAFTALDMLDQSVWQAWAFGPALVDQGVPCDTTQSKIKVANPRCAIGYYEPGHYCFIVVDGRQSGYSKGMTLDELAETFASLGCKAAYNFDGGATAMMVFDGKLVNHPTSGGRSSSDIIYF